MQERPIHLVVKAIQTQIPFDFSDRAGLLDSLEHIMDSVGYTAPEAMKVRWFEVADVLEHYLGDPSESTWKQTISDIFANKLDYQTYIQELS